MEMSESHPLWEDFTSSTMHNMLYLLYSYLSSSWGHCQVHTCPNTVIPPDQAASCMQVPASAWGPAQFICHQVFPPRTKQQGWGSTRRSTAAVSTGGKSLHAALDFRPGGCWARGQAMYFVDQSISKYSLSVRSESRAFTVILFHLHQTVVTDITVSS